MRSSTTHISDALIVLNFLLERGYTQSCNILLDFIVANYRSDIFTLEELCFLDAVSEILSITE
jgi:hypothetical protein